MLLKMRARALWAEPLPGSTIFAQAAESSGHGYIASVHRDSRLGQPEGARAAQQQAPRKHLLSNGHCAGSTRFGSPAIAVSSAGHVNPKGGLSCSGTRENQTDC